MPLLAGMIATLFGGLFQFLVTTFGKRVALALSFGAMFLAAITAAVATVAALVAGLEVVTPDVVVDVAAFLFPSNTETVMAGVVTVELVKAGVGAYAILIGRGQAQ